MIHYGVLSFDINKIKKIYIPINFYEKISDRVFSDNGIVGVYVKINKTYNKEYDLSSGYVIFSLKKNIWLDILF